MAGFAISLQELQDRFHLSQAQLDAEVMVDDLAEVSSNIADHEMLGPTLGLKADDMAAIHEKNSQDIQRLTVLTKWKQRFVWKATYRVLIEALLRRGRADCAQNMCEMLAQSKYIGIN